jgi:hypothetical protein
MPSFTFIALTLFIFLAIVGGIIGIILEGQHVPAGSGVHNPATHDTVFPIVGWAVLFALYLAVEYIGAQSLTAGFKAQLGTFAVLPFFYGMLATGWLIWRSVRRIHAWMRGREPVVWHAVPLLSALRFPILLAAAILSAALEHWFAGLSLSFFLLAGVTVLFALIRKPAPVAEAVSPHA